MKDFTLSDIPDLTDKNILITGATKGLGYFTAKALAKKNANILLHSRNVESGEISKKQILKDYPESKIEIIPFNLASKKSIKEGADYIKSKYSNIHIIINNAGVMHPPYHETEDGYEIHFGVNYLSHFILNNLLLDIIKDVKGSKIVTVGSIAADIGEEQFNLDKIYKKESYHKGSYGISKFCNLLFSYELERHLRKINAQTISLASHPGVSITNIIRHSSKIRLLLIKILDKIFLPSPEKASLTTIKAATDKDAKANFYYAPSGFLQIKGSPKIVPSPPLARREDLAKSLWDLSKTL